jgi:hypothetical protein
MNNINKEKTFESICVTVFFITIAMTPWLNSDSLIIPKLILLFCMALFLVPKLITLRTILFSNLIYKVLFVIVILITIQMILVILNSESPIEQQVFGRTGRGLGLITEFSLLVFIISSALFIKLDKVNFLNLMLISSCVVTTVYSVLQRFNLDVFDWTTKTNGIIGTLGNPNFQASFAAMALFPSIVYFWEKKWGKIYSALLVLPIAVLIYISQSTQGYVTVFFSIFIFSLFYLWYRNKKFFIGAFSIFTFAVIYVILGMLNKGALSSILYKISIQSRGEMFRTSISVANENPVFGVGLDSLGDYYLLYRSEETANGIAEFTDNSHNIFLNYASTGGYLLSALQLLLVILVLICIVKIQKNIRKFDRKFTALFCAWACYQQQSLISPANISMLTWNAIISGSIIGIAVKYSNDNLEMKNLQGKLYFSRPFSIFFLMVAIFIIYPYFNVDRLQLASARTGNANLAVQSALSYPQSSIRYSRIGQELIKSNLPAPALELARSAVKFNPNAISAWALLLVNGTATLEERIKAKDEILRLDPYNKDMKTINFGVNSQ